MAAPSIAPSRDPGALATLRLVLRIAMRELRGGLKGFRIFLGCLALGVALIAGVGSLSSAIVEGLKAEGRALLSGDVGLRLNHRPATEEELSYLAAEGVLAASIQMRAMAHGEPVSPAAPDEARNPARDVSLVELKGVDGRYPLYGRMLLEGGGALADALARRIRAPGGEARWGAVIESALAVRLGLEPGDGIRIGGYTYELADIIEWEPDRATDGFALGPRVMVALDSLPETGIILPGSLVEYHYRIKLAPETDLAAWEARLAARFPDAGWRVRDRENGTPGVARFVDRVALFLTFVGLTALVVGGVGVGNAVKSYLDGKAETISTLKCLGASGRLVFQIYLAQVMLVAAQGILLGLVAGVFVPVGLGALLPDRLPVPAQFGVFPGPLLLAALYGVLTALAFVIWPLARARDVSAARLFRDLVAPERSWPRPRYLLALAAALLALVGLAVYQAGDRRFALMFVAGAAGSFVVLRFAAYLVMRIADHVRRPSRPSLRIALANLHRPGAPTASVLLSMGLGLTLLVTVALIQGNVSRQVRGEIPQEAPAFFFVDIQPDQAARFDEVVRGIEGVSDLRRLPMLRGRIVRFNGEEIDPEKIAPEGRWVIRGDRSLTYAVERPSHNPLVKGEWWPADYDGPPLVSMAAEEARELGLDVGDRITVNVLGREIEAGIASLRGINWGGFNLNFVVIFSPGVLESAPHTHVASLRATPAAEDLVLARITDAFPNVSAIRVKEALEIVDQLLRDLDLAIGAVAGVTLLASSFVLAGAMAAGQRRRIYDAVVLKVLGARRADILKAYLSEYGLLGFVSALVAAGAGSLAAYFTITISMGADWAFMPGTVALTILGAVALTLVLGLLGTFQALGQKPAPVLRAQ